MTGEQLVRECQRAWPELTWRVSRYTARVAEACVYDGRRRVAKVWVDLESDWLDRASDTRLVGACWVFRGARLQTIATVTGRGSTPHAALRMLRRKLAAEAKRWRLAAEIVGGVL